MGDFVQTRDLGVSILGTAQVDYTVGGVAGRTYDEAVAAMGLKRAVAVEDALPAYTAAIRARQQKLEELGQALADLSATLANFGNSPKTTDTQKVVGGSEAYAAMAKYGIAADYFSGDNHDTIQFQHIQKAQADIQFAMDMADNDVQQDAASLSSLVQKRDNAYQMAFKLMSKANQTRSTGIKYIV